GAATAVGHGGGADHTALCRGVAGIVARPHAIVVGGGWCQSTVGIGGAGRGADQVAIAVHVISGYPAAAGVIGGPVPAERDAGGGAGARGKAARYAGCSGIATGCGDADGDRGRTGDGVVVVGGYRTQGV